jgi:hypothetical protein
VLVIFAPRTSSSLRLGRGCVIPIPVDSCHAEKTQTYNPKHGPNSHKELKKPILVPPWALHNILLQRPDALAYWNNYRHACQLHGKSTEQGPASLLPKGTPTLAPAHTQDALSPPLPPLPKGLGAATQTNLLSRSSAKEILGPHQILFQAAGPIGQPASCNQENQAVGIFPLGGDFPTR